MSNVKSDFVRQFGLAQKFFDSAEQQGFTPAMLNTVAERPSLLSDFLLLYRGDVAVAPLERTVDLNEAPVVADDSVVYRHVKAGIVRWKELQVEMYAPAFPSRKHQLWEYKLDEGFLRPKYMTYHPFNQRTLANANLQQYFLAYPHLFRKEWLGVRPLIFWGTIFQKKPTNNAPSGNGQFWVKGLKYSSGDLVDYEMQVSQHQEYDHPVLFVS